MDEASGLSLNLGLENPTSLQHTSTPGCSRNSLSPKRRSQRQIDRQEMEQLKKIRAENEELLKKEKENMNQALQSSQPKKDEVDVVPESSIILPDSVAPAELTSIQPISRLSAIRQELQQKILAVDPVKPKAVASPHSLNKILAGKQSTTPIPKVQSGKSVDDVGSPQPFLSKETSLENNSPLSVDVNTLKSAICKTPGEQESLTSPASRPRRENRQPPKHLREAFNQLEFEGVEKLVKRTSRNPTSSSAAENSSQESEDETTANDKTNGL